MGYEKIVKLLLKAKANVNFKNEDVYRRTPLWLALNERHEGIVSSQ